MAKIYLKKIGTNQIVNQADVTGKSNREIESAIIQILKKTPPGTHYVDDSECDVCKTKSDRRIHSIIVPN